MPRKLARSDSVLEPLVVLSLVNEEDLIRSVLDGDASAYEVLVATHQDRLFSAMINVVGSADEAEDVVQETFIQAYVKLDKFQMNSRFYTWIYRIAFNYALGRRRKRKRNVSLEATRETVGLEPVDDIEGPDANIVRNENARVLHDALQQVSEAHRKILVLREMENMAYEDIAEVLDISLGTVRSRLSRARASLKSALEKTPDWKPD